jgi:hypothetical protein
MPYRLYIKTPVSIKYIDDLFETKMDAIEMAIRIAEEINTTAKRKLISLIRLSMKDEHLVKLFHSEECEVFMEKI